MHFQVKSILKNITRNILYMFFTTHKLQPQFLSNIYLNLTTTCNRIFLKFIFLKPQKKKKHTCQLTVVEISVLATLKIIEV
jgi:hypothetical protein